MRVLIALSLSFVVFAMPCGCFRDRRTVTQKDSVAKLTFTGNLLGAEFHVDREGRELWRWTEIREAHLYEAKPGPCTVQVRRGEAIIVRRNILLVDGQIVEISIP